MVDVRVEACAAAGTAQMTALAADAEERLRVGRMYSETKSYSSATGKRTSVQTTSAGGLSASASTGFSGWSMTRTSGAAFSLPALAKV